MDEYYRAIRLLPAWLAQPLARLPQNTAEKSARTAAADRLWNLPVHCWAADDVGRAAGMPADPARQDAGCPADGRDPLCALRRFSTYPSGRTGAGLPDHGIRLPCGGGRSVRIARPGGCCAAASFVAEFPHCASNLYGTSGGAVHPLQGHFIGALLVGEPDSGKTTLLRQIARELAAQKRAVAVIDERGELFSAGAAEWRCP